MARKMRKFASAGSIGRNVEETVGKALASIGSTRPDIKADTTELKAATAPQKAQSFGEAFKAARAKALDGGPKTFTWGGKSFTTQVKGEGASKPMVSKPAAPAANKPTVNKPAAPAANKPTVNKPAAPAVNKPAAPAVNKPAAPAANKPAAQRPKDSTVTGRQMLANLFSAGREKEKEISRRAGKGPGSGERSGMQMLANRQRKIEASSKAETERRRAALGRGVKKAKGGSIDGCAIRGKTRAPMKKGK
jgi:hypothetical protein